MGFIDWFMGYALVWVIIGLLAIAAVIFTWLAWQYFKEWRDRR